MVIETVSVTPAAHAALSGHARSRPEVETGGILLGRMTGTSGLLITRASPPGPRAVHGRLRFSRDTRFAQRYLDEIHERSAGSEDYVGEWHVHRAMNAPPSYVDRRSLWRIARRRNYATENPILVIVEHSPPEIAIRAYGFVVKPRRHWRELPLEL